jgi:hypothetical protein
MKQIESRAWTKGRMTWALEQELSLCIFSLRNRMTQHPRKKKKKKKKVNSDGVRAAYEIT